MDRIPRWGGSFRNGFSPLGTQLQVKIARHTVIGNRWEDVGKRRETKIFLFSIRNQRTMSAMNWMGKIELREREKKSCPVQESTLPASCFIVVAHCTPLSLLWFLFFPQKKKNRPLHVHTLSYEPKHTFPPMSTPAANTFLHVQHTPWHPPSPLSPNSMVRESLGKTWHLFISEEGLPSLEPFWYAAKCQKGWENASVLKIPLNCSLSYSFYQERYSEILVTFPFFYLGSTKKKFRNR